MTIIRIVPAQRADAWVANTTRIVFVRNAAKGGVTTIGSACAPSVDGWAANTIRIVYAGNAGRAGMPGMLKNLIHRSRAAWLGCDQSKMSPDGNIWFTESAANCTILRQGPRRGNVTDGKRYMPAEDVFEGEFFASVYDYVNPWSVSDDFYVDRAVGGGGPVLDLGCGTGMLACGIAAKGLGVTGVDPAAAMLQVARTRPGGDRVNWIESDGRSLRLSQGFNLFIWPTTRFRRY